MNKWSANNNEIRRAKKNANTATEHSFNCIHKTIHIKSLIRAAIECFTLAFPFVSFVAIVVVNKNWARTKKNIHASTEENSMEQIICLVDLLKKTEKNAHRHTTEEEEDKQKRNRALFKCACWFYQV